MRLSAAARLALWEAGSGASPAARDLALLDAGFPGVEHRRLRGLTIGRRDAWLLRMYEAAFGSRLDGTFDCESCGETLEVTVEVSDLLGGPGGAGSSGNGPVDGSGNGPADGLEGGPVDSSEGGLVDGSASSGWTPLDADGYQVMVRLPDSDDLAAVDVPGRRAREVLADRVVRATRDGRPVPVEALPAPVLDAALRAMAESDPLAETVIATTCLRCGAPCHTLLDIGAFLWAHVQADARTLLSEVDTLARAYGWTETEILALGERRRVAYLELAR